MALKIGNSSIKGIYLGYIKVKEAYLGNKLIYTNDPQTEIVDSYNYFVFNTRKVSYTNIIELANDRAGDTTVWDGLTDWGDGGVHDGNSHRYYNDGVYIVKTKYILSNYKTRDFDTCKMLIECNNINKNMTSYDKLFNECENLTYVNTTDLNTSKVTNMSGMFLGCSSLTSLDLSSFNTSEVTDMSHMFCECRNLTSLDISSFNTSKVTNMYYMFGSCYSLTSLDLSSFNTSEVTNMNGMFLGCSSLTSLDLSSFNTSKVTSMYGMFSGCSSLTSLNLSNWNMDNVTDTTSMFFRCDNLTLDNIIMDGCNDTTKAKIQEAFASRNN